MKLYPKKYMRHCTHDEKHHSVFNGPRIPEASESYDILTCRECEQLDSEAPITYTITPSKPISRVTAADIPPGLNAEDVALD